MRSLKISAQLFYGRGCAALGMGEGWASQHRYFWLTLDHHPSSLTQWHGGRWPGPEVWCCADNTRDPIPIIPGQYCEAVTNDTLWWISKYLSLFINPGQMLSVTRGSLGPSWLSMTNLSRNVKLLISSRSVGFPPGLSIILANNGDNLNSQKDICISTDIPNFNVNNLS